MSAPAGLYIHVPFCSAVCPYCDFAVQIGKPALRQSFVETLLDEVALCADWAHPIDTIYFGGGTPSMLDRTQLGTIIERLREHLPVAADAKLHFEANPEDVDADALAKWRELGVEFLSLGVQSFDDTELRTLGRRHDGTQGRRAVQAALAAGFQTVSVDLMFGLPGQTLSSLRSNLVTLGELGPTHASMYQLTVHEGTTFARWREQGKLHELNDDAQGEMFEMVHAILAGYGLDAYEVSNFARSESHRSSHNQKYWRHTPYLGLGPSAHSFDGRSRWWNHRTTGPYTQAVARGERPIAEREMLDAADLALEEVMLRLRTVDGLDIRGFHKRHDIDLESTNAGFIRELKKDGIARYQDGNLQLTTRGLALADWVIEQVELD
jgi:oxygen-independent coproporphyrinogen III oxidase